MALPSPGTVLRSSGVGAVATLTDLGLLALLVSGLGLAPRVASVPALVAGVLVQFVGNKCLAFRDRSPRWATQALAFAVVETCGLLLNAWLFDLVVARVPWPYLIVRLLTTNVVYFAFCLPLWTRVFRASGAPRRGVES